MCLFVFIPDFDLTCCDTLGTYSSQFYLQNVGVGPGDLIL
jgi:hypothetical protein